MKQRSRLLAIPHRACKVGCIRTLAIMAGLFALTSLSATAQTITVRNATGMNGSTVTFAAQTSLVNNIQTVEFDLLEPFGTSGIDTWHFLGTNQTIYNTGAASFQYQIPNSLPTGTYTFRAVLAYGSPPYPTAVGTLTVPLVIDTDNGLICNNSAVFYTKGGQALPMRVVDVNGFAQFWIKGNITITAPVILKGSRAVSLFAANDVLIGPGATLDVSGYMQDVYGAVKPQFGSGRGAKGGAGAAGGLGGPGGTKKGKGGKGGDGSQLGLVTTKRSGKGGGSGDDGSNAAGNPGNAGGSGGYGNPGGYGFDGLFSPGSGGAPAAPTPAVSSKNTGGKGGSYGKGGGGGFDGKNGINDYGGLGGGGGAMGLTGANGALGNCGLGGRNTGTGLTASAGGGGGAASSGSSGAGGGGGGQGGGGGGGGAVNNTDKANALADGAGGGAGGAGGVGGKGGASGAGGKGGAGGGILAIYARGRIEVDGTLISKGQNGDRGQLGSAGQAGSNGSQGTGGGNVGGIMGGNGGDAGTANNGGSGVKGAGGDSGGFTEGAGGGGGGGGGMGGAGGTGGTGGTGGGGAGGSIKLFASAVFVETGATIDTTPGVGGAAGGNGQQGRFILARNNQDVLDGSLVNTSLENYGGWVIVNPFIVTNYQTGVTPISTPLIPDLSSSTGAAAYGVLDNDASAIPHLAANAPAGAVAALVLCDTSFFGAPTEFTGWQYLLYVNIGAGPLNSPHLGVGGANDRYPLRQDGVNNCQFFPGDPGPITVSQLNSMAVYGTFIPNTLDTFNASTSTWGKLNITRSQFTQVMLPGGSYYVYYLTP